MTTGDSTTDCLVIGAGAAGLSAAMWLRSYNLSWEWVSDEPIGGILRRVDNPIDSLPGGPYPDGPAIIDTFEKQSDRLEGLEPREGRVTDLTRREDRWRAQLDSGTTLSAETVIVATGTSYRMLGVPGEAEGLGRCVSQSTAGDGEKFAGRTVAVVGGGDAGFEGAWDLAELGCHVHIILRNSDFRARPSFVERVQHHPRIFFLPIPSVVTRITPLDPPRGCRLHVDVDGDSETLEAACLFVRIGVDPVYPDITPLPGRNGEEHLRVDREQRTSEEGLLAAGDVTDIALQAVSTAVGAGARAAHTAARRLDVV